MSVSFSFYDVIPSINQLYYCYYCYYYLLLLLLPLLLIFLFFLLIIDITIFVRYCFFSQCCYSSIVIKLTLLLLSLLLISSSAFLLFICEFQPLKFFSNWQFFFSLKRFESENGFLFVHCLVYLFTFLLFYFLSCNRRLEIYSRVVLFWLPWKLKFFNHLFQFSM